MRWWWMVAMRRIPRVTNHRVKASQPQIWIIFCTRSLALGKWWWRILHICKSTETAYAYTPPPSLILLHTHYHISCSHITSAIERPIAIAKWMPKIFHHEIVHPTGPINNVFGRKFRCLTKNDIFINHNLFLLIWFLVFWRAQWPWTVWMRVCVCVCAYTRPCHKRDTMEQQTYYDTQGTHS